MVLFRTGAAALALSLAACLQPGAPAEAATAPLSQTPDGKKLQLAFADEFDSFRPYRNGQGVWRTTFRDGRDDKGDDFNLRTLKWNKEVQLYVDPDMRGHRGKHADDEPAGLRVANDRPLGLNPFTAKNGMLEIRFDRAPAEHAAALGGFQ